METNLRGATTPQKQIRPIEAGGLIEKTMVPTAGLEPARVSPPPPQDGVSTNSTTSALTLGIRIHFAGVWAGAGVAGTTGGTGSFSSTGAGWDALIGTDLPLL